MKPRAVVLKNVWCSCGMFVSGTLLMQHAVSPRHVAWMANGRHRHHGPKPRPLEPMP